jgi:hypothetical protein
MAGGEGSEMTATGIAPEFLHTIPLSKEEKKNYCTLAV